MRILVAACLVVASCGAHSVAASGPTPSPVRSNVPWVADGARPTPIPEPTVEPRPTAVPDCRASDLVGVAYRGQGAGGWWVRGLMLGNRGEARCVVAGPLSAAYLDAAGAAIATAGVRSPTWSSPGWAVLEPRSLPVDDHVIHPGQARITLESYGDCEHRELRAIAVTFATPAAVIRFAVEPQPVGGRCDAPGQRLGVSSWAIAPTEPPVFPTPAPLPLAFAINAPAVAFAGESLTYVVRVTNAAAAPYTWGHGCPIYLESLPGREATPSLVPDRGGKWEPPARTYAGFAKELHPLNCAGAGAIPAGGEASFEMRIAVPRDALGPETLHWEIASPLPNVHVTAPLEILPPRGR
ncbi:MAG TPA: hypothetical protein VGT60_11030 [Candidatus Limnocylindria bacterium]|nr:hypothetical protein [Candidatus Limnocylindria bacterium]